MKNLSCILIILLSSFSILTSAAAGFLSNTLIEILCYKGLMVCAFAFVVIYSNKLNSFDK